MSVPAHPAPHCRLRPPGPPSRADVRGVEVHDERLAAVLPAGTPLLELYAHTTFGEGPVWWAARDLLVWSDIEGRRLLGWRPDGAVEVVRDATPFTNGNTVDVEGRLVTCEHGTRSVVRMTPDGEIEPLATHYEGRRLNSPNDVIVHTDGTIWFSDPSYGIENSKQGCPARSELGHNSVYRLDPRNGALTRMADLEMPNGLAFSPDGRTLYVSDSALDRHEIVAFVVEADGTLGEHRPLRVVEPGVPDGFRVDVRGWIWTSSDAGVQVLSPDGELLGVVHTPATATNCAFGGESGRRLFITGAGHLWAVDLAG